MGIAREKSDDLAVSRQGEDIPLEMEVLCGIE